jgi:hypothetical protein
MNGMCDRVTRGVLNLAGAGAGVMIALAMLQPAAAQDCARLQAQIARLGGGHSQQLADAVQKQRNEIDRTETYARSVGCENRQFLFFGSPPPPQCGAIAAQIQRMRANFAQMQAELDRYGAAAVDAQRRDLIGRYNGACAAGLQTTAVPARGLDPLNAPPLYETGPMRQVPLDAPDDTPVDESNARGGGKAVCVRLADGGFFPVSYTAQRGGLADLEDLCRALCPNTEVRLFTYRLDGDIEDAVGIDGESYASLPNAHRFEKVYDPAASCKPPGQSWQQALSEAEQRFGSSAGSDIMVTQEKSDELARPRPNARASAAAKPKADTKTPKSKAPLPAAKPSEDASALDAAAAAQVPTAGQESSGISTSEGAGSALITGNQGEVREVIGHDGVKRRIRIVAPSL